MMSIGIAIQHQRAELTITQVGAQSLVAVFSSSGRAPACTVRRVL